MNNEKQFPFDRSQRYRGGLAAFVFAATASAALSASCAGLDDPVVLATPENDAAPSFTPQDAGDAGEAAVPEALRCIGTECPFPYATCASSDSSGRPAFKCQHNLLTDNDNCGACGSPCRTYPDFGVFGHCSNGVCEPQCEGHRRDCNNTSDDGCETFIGLDPKNCGACGNVCPEGVDCNDGICGCTGGKTNCSGVCADLSIDNGHCGRCGNECPPPPQDAGPTPANMMYSCSGGKCNELVCIGSFRNCNTLIGDGCEIDVEREIAPGLLDPEHCGSCDEKCAPSEECRRLFGGIIACRCKPNETMCGMPGNYVCADIATNPEHCGLCNHECPFVDLRFRHQQATCIKGVCGTECEPGWGDCNNNPADGCETNLTYDGANCGACGTRCNSGLGQPCVDGRCLTVECDAGDPVTR